STMRMVRAVMVFPFSSFRFQGALPATLLLLGARLTAAPVYAEARCAIKDDHSDLFHGEIISEIWRKRCGEGARAQPCRENRRPAASRPPVAGHPAMGGSDLSLRARARRHRGDQ